VSRYYLSTISMKILAFNIICFFLCFLQAQSCDVSPEFWCNSIEIAEKCNALEACKTRIFNELNRYSASPVKVDVHFETYCPDSIAFYLGQVFPTWSKLKDSGVLDLNLFVYGKAFSIPLNDGSYAFSCQHGQKECDVNTIENCIIKHSGDRNVYMPVIKCIEEDRNHLAVSQQCSESYGLNWSEIETCWKGDEGMELMYKTGEVTHNLDPKLNWVPWVVLNGVHTDEIQDAAINDLTKLVCDTYSGFKPDVCKTRFVKVNERSTFKKLISRNL